MPRGSRSTGGVKRTRRKGPKSKSGCMTCKTRRIKCDETRPSCTKCISGGWSCDGYPGQRDAGDIVPSVPSKEVREVRSREIQPVAQNDITEIELTYAQPSSREESPALTDIHPLSQEEVSEAESTDAQAVPTNEASTPESTDTRLISHGADLISPSSSLLRNSVSDFAATSMEHRSFSFFVNMTAPDLANFSASSFWSRVVLQIASTEKAVQHALVAIAALHEDHLREMEHQKPMNQLFSLSQYNKAIHTLNSRLTNDRLSFLIALITCHLFVYLELLRKSPESALTQFYSGLKLLPLYNKRYAKLDNEVTRSEEDPNIYQQLAWTFSQYRLSVLGTFFPIPRALHNPGKNPGLIPYLGKPFSSCHEAKERLHTLLVHSFKPYHRVPGPAALEDATSMEIKLREELALHLNDWTVQLEHFIAQCSPPPTTQDMRALNMLKIQNLIAIIWNSVAMAGSQTAYDLLADQFKSVVSLAEMIIINRPDQKEAPATSLTVILHPQEQIPNLSHNITCTEPPLSSIGEITFEDEVTYPLYFTVIKCRSPTLRRKALSLLSLISPTIQKVRNTKLFTTIAAHVVSFEEDQCLQPVTEDITTWPAEAQRIQRIYFMPIYDRERKTQTAMFVWQPSGPGTDMKNWMQRFEL